MAVCTVAVLEDSRYSVV